MIWGVPANNKSSTWITSDTRSVRVGPQASVKHVRDEAALPEDLLQMVLPASRCAPQNTNHGSFAGIQCFKLPPGWRLPSFMCPLKKAVFASAVNTVTVRF